MSADRSIGGAETQREHTAFPLAVPAYAHYTAARTMCTLALYFRVFPDYPLVIAANRDEALNRPSVPPLALQQAPLIFGGKDLTAGGTWLGVSEYGLIAGMLNRHTPQPADPTRRSRGLLCLDALRWKTARQAAAWVQRQPADQYNPYNFLLADQENAYVLHPSDTSVCLQELKSGVHLLTNMNLNDPECPRIAGSFQRFEDLVDDMRTKSEGSKEDSSAFIHPLFQLLRERLADHAIPLDPRAQDPRNGLCVHLDGYGTCSSTLLAYTTRESRFIYHFAPGAPCQTDYKEVALPSPFTSQPPSTT